MRKQLLILFGAMSLAGCQSEAPKSFTPEAMQQTLRTLQGDPVQFEHIVKQYKGKTLVLEVWASWCSDCVRALPDTKALQAKHPQASFVFLSVDKTMDKWHEAIEKHALAGDHYWVTDGMRGDFGDAINLDWIPRYIIIDKDQNIVTYRAIDKDFEAMDKTLTQIQ